MEAAAIQERRQVKKNPSAEGHRASEHSFWHTWRFPSILLSQLRIVKWNAGERGSVHGSTGRIRARPIGSFVRSALPIPHSAFREMGYNTSRKEEENDTRVLTVAGSDSGASGGSRRI